MKYTYKFSALVALVLFWAACKPVSNLGQSKEGEISFQILQINDVYEIAPLENGKIGGMARVAQLEKELLEDNPNTLSMLIGDFVNPSVFGTLSHEGAKIRGKQMIEAMNEAGIDLVTFGNHEFDLKEKELLARIEESRFDWIVANLKHAQKNATAPFQKQGKPIQAYKIYEFKNPKGKSLKVGFIAVCINSNRPDYVVFEDPFVAAKNAYAMIKDSVDFVLALTHLDIDEDKKLAAEMPQIKLFMGGHDHSNMNILVGESRITKADANAKTAYVHTINYNPTSKKLDIQSVLRRLDEKIRLEPKTTAVVDKWMGIANKAFQAEGFNPNEQVLKLPFELDAREQSLRYRVSVGANLVAEAVLASNPKAELAFVNTGSIRIDDVLVGTLTQYDIIRMLPFGGQIHTFDIKGSLLRDVIQIGRQDNIGKGGFLAYANIKFKDGEIFIGKEKLNPEKVYKASTSDFMLTGGEANLGFLKPEHPDIDNIDIPTQPDDVRKDIRQAVIQYFKNIKLDANPCKYVDCPKGTLCNKGVCE